MRLFGQEYSRRDLQRYFGTGHGLFGIRRLTYDEGRARGLQVAEFKTGSGLRFHVLIDRGLDLGLCEYQGIPFSFGTAGGETTATFYESQGDGFMRSWGGGLVTTCGLTHLGAPDLDRGEELGLHGRIHGIPGEEIATQTKWVQDEGYLELRGKVREAKMLGYNVVLDRKISSKIGESKIVIEDAVTNEGFTTVPHMILYHCNFGHPLLDAGTELLTKSIQVRARDEVAAREGADYAFYEGPKAGYPDTVFYHDLEADEDGLCTVALINKRTHLGAYLRFSQAELPRFIQWKYTHAGDYATGLEPANCLVEGRSKERERGTLQYLEPGEQRTYRLEIGFLTNKIEQQDFVKNVFQR